MAVKGVRMIIYFECIECKNRNYMIEKNKKNDLDRFEFKKYCKFCWRYIIYREIK